MGLAWPGFRRVRHQVCKKIGRRLSELHLGDPDAYRAYLDDHPQEWEKLESFCLIPISRFYRDRETMDRLATTTLPRLAQAARDQGRTTLKAWSAGCASGEEPYTLAIIWRLTLADRFPDLTFHILATDADPHLLTRARAARYKPSSLRELPPDWRDKAFSHERESNLYTLKPALRENVTFALQDLRKTAPSDRFDLILCRNMAFTYFDQERQRRAAHVLRQHLRPGGVLVVGEKEEPPGI